MFNEILTEQELIRITGGTDPPPPLPPGTPILPDPH